MSQRYHALIPARGGSVGIPKKNLQTIGGKSLVARAVINARLVPEIAQVFLSSDDEEILQEGLNNGALGVKRDACLALSDSTAKEVVTDFLSKIKERNISVDDFLIYLQPTSPFRTVEHIEECIQISKLNPYRAVVSVVQVHTPLEKLITISDGIIEPVLKSAEKLSSNRQNLTQIYSPNGAIYIFQIKKFLNHGDFPIIGATPYEMSSINSIDIDSDSDLRLARLIEGS